MKRFYKNVCSFAFASVLFCASIFAQSNHQNIFDKAGVLTAEQVEALEMHCDSVFADFSFPLYVVTLNDSEHTDIESFAEELYATMDLGYGSSKTGMMLLMNFAYRDYDICAYGNTAHKIFTDSRKNSIASGFLPSFREDEWYKGFYSYIAGSAKYLKREIKPASKSNSVIDYEVLLQALLIAFGISLIMALLICLVMKSKMKSVKKAKRADSYILQSEVKLSQSSDTFTHNTVQVIPIAQNNSSGKTTISSGGFSHSSGKF